MGKHLQFNPEVIAKIIGYVKKEHDVNTKVKCIYIRGVSTLEKVDTITQERIRILQKRGYKVFSQPTLFD